MTSSRNRRAKRNGALLAEFAVCLPILVAFFFAMWEYTRMEIVRQTVKAAAFEGARQGIVEGATAEEMEEAAQRVLASFTVREAELESTLTAETCVMDIEVPLLANSYAASIFSRDARIRVRIELIRESFNG